MVTLDITKCIQTNFKTGEDEAIHVPGVLDEIIEKLNIVTVLETGEILKYENGRYVDNGKQLVSRTLERDLGKLVNWKGQAMYNKRVKEEIIDRLKDRTYVSVDEFDSNLSLINMKNGLYNWETGILEDHNPLYLSKIQIPINYNPDATCKKIEEILRDILQPKDYIKMLEFIAHIFYRKYAIRKAFILLGPRRTGKSTFLNLLDNLVGDENCSAVPLSDLDNMHERVKLCNKLLNKCGELENIPLHKISIFKNLTGSDSITARDLYCSSFKFTSYANFICASNIIPPSMDDEAFYDRIEILEFLRRFDPQDYDQSRMDAISDPDELSGLFNLCIQKLGPLLKKREYTNATSVEEVRIKYRSSSDPLKTFIELYIVRCPKEHISCEEVYNAYVEHCSEYRVDPLHKIEFDNKFSSKIKGMKQSTMKIGRRDVCSWDGIKML